MKGNRYPNVEVFLDRQIGMESFDTDWPKKKRKWRESFVIFMFILFLSRLYGIFLNPGQQR